MTPSRVSAIPDWHEGLGLEAYVQVIRLFWPLAYYSAHF